MKKIPNVLTPSQLQKFWNSFQKDYTSYMERNLFSVFTSMCNITNITNKFQSKDKVNILELACGPGSSLEHLVYLAQKHNINNKEINIFGTDISKNMLDIAASKVREIPYINTTLKHANEDKLSVMNNKTNINLHLLECDNENLVFDNNQFDVVLSNFSISLVSNPDQMIKESHRVLKNHGVCCYSTCGRPENSPPFSLISNILKNNNIDLPNQRSFFHLSKVEKLKGLMLNNGFSTFNYSYTYSPFNIFTPEEFYFMLDSPTYKEVMDSLSEEKKERIKSDLKDSINHILKDKNELFGTEAIILISEKII